MRMPSVSEAWFQGRSLVQAQSRNWPCSPRVLEKPVLLIQERAGDSRALRLLSAERSEEIFPILLEEVVKIGFPRALVLEVDFESGEVKATASLNCDRNEVEKFRTSLWARDNPIMTVLQRLSPGVLPNH